MFRFHWITLIQDTLDMTGTGYEYNFTYKIVYLGNRLFNACTVKRCKTGLEHNTQEYFLTRLKMLKPNVDSEKVPTQLPAYQENCSQRSYPQCTSRDEQ